MKPTILEKSTFSGVLAASFSTHASLNISSQVIRLASGRRILESRLLASWLTFFISGTTHRLAITVEVVGEFSDPFDDLLVIIAIEGRNGGQ